MLKLLKSPCVRTSGRVIDLWNITSFCISKTAAGLGELWVCALRDLNVTLFLSARWKS
jgi:hypothetical protein